MQILLNTADLRAFYPLNDISLKQLPDLTFKLVFPPHHYSISARFFFLPLERCCPSPSSSLCLRSAEGIGFQNNRLTVPLGTLGMKERVTAQV